MTTSAATTEPKTSTTARFKDWLSRTMPRLRDFLVYAVAQVRIYDKPYAGIMHALIFWGVTIQLIGTAINLQQMALFLPFVFTFPRGNAYLLYELFMDLAGLAILLGIGMAAFRRLVLRPKSLESRWDDYYALVMLTLIPLAGFTLESMRLIAASPDWYAWSPIGSAFAAFYRALGITPETAVSVHMSLWWTHAILALTLVASIPFTKFRHLIMTPLNIIQRPRRTEGALEKIEDIEETELLGVGDITEFKPQQLLSFEACLNCGRCEENCPCTISGMPYSPRLLIQNLRDETYNSLIAKNGNASNGHELLGETFSEEYPWQCTTCGACIERCPALVNPVDEIVDLRRYLVLTTGKMPKSVGDTMRNMERQDNPWGMPPEDRIAWTEGLDVRELAPGDETDVLLFMGCAAAYDDRNKQVARSFVRLLQKADVDFGILGLDEVCCGETARRMGHEYLFQVFAEQNIEMFSQIKFNRIVTQCPHCFNTLKNEYPQMGGDFEVLHYSEYLASLSLPLAAAPTNGNALQGTFTYHDSCYLGRYNNIYKAPRTLLKQANADLVEMSRRDQNSFCCGGGGGQMWMETDPNTRINHRRLQDAIDAKADLVATACPYCLIMFDDAIRSKGLSEQIQVIDIAEVLDKALS
jgi:Fe-S oxidoreductase/nitrate reductase gamma subunit